MINKFIGIITGLMMSQSIFANTVVLLNGMTETNSWLQNGIAQRLSSVHNVKILRLPYRETINTQSEYLNRELNKIKGDITLVGHSAGGIVARNVLVRARNDNIKQLITIASPHQGSDLARYSSFLNDSIPFGNMFSLVILPDEASAYLPLRQLKKGSSFLKSLNSIPHKNICYSSIIKSGGYVNNSYADTHSQNMNNIKGLIRSGNRSTTIYVKDGHGLHPNDAHLISQSILSCNPK